MGLPVPPSVEPIAVASTSDEDVAVGESAIKGKLRPAKMGISEEKAEYMAGLFLIGRRETYLKILQQWRLQHCFWYRSLRERQ